MSLIPLRWSTTSHQCHVTDIAPGRGLGGFANGLVVQLEARFSPERYLECPASWAQARLSGGPRHYALFLNGSRYRGRKIRQKMEVYKQMSAWGIDALFPDALASTFYIEIELA